MNAEIIKTPDGNNTVALIPETPHEKFIIDANELLKKQQEDLEHCVAMNTQVNVEYGELCKSYDELKAKTASLPQPLDQPLDAKGNRNWEGEYYRLLNVYNKDIGTLQEEIKGLRKEVEGRKLEVSHWNGLAATEAKKAEGWRVKYLEYYDKCVELTKEKAELKRQISEYFNPDLRAERDTLNNENVELKRQLAAMTETVFSKGIRDTAMPHIQRAGNVLKLYDRLGSFILSLDLDDIDEHSHSEIVSWSNHIAQVWANMFVAIISEPKIIRDENDLP
jgi:hypothetical protein